MVQVFAEVFLNTLVVKFFVNIAFIISSILMSQDYQIAQTFSFLSIHADNVLWQECIQISNTKKSNMKNPTLSQFSTFCLLTNVL